MSINKAILTGNLTRDAELRKTQSGADVLTFGVAVNERRRNQSGEWEDYANFIDCVVFGNRATKLAQYLPKGTKVAIEGRLHYNSWEDASGARRSKLDVIVNEIEFLSARNTAPSATQPHVEQATYGRTYGSGQPPQQGNVQPQSYQQPPLEQASPYADEEIPF